MSKFNYYTCDYWKFAKLRKFNKKEPGLYLEFFKADCIKTIRKNCENIKGKCARNILLKKVEIGKKYKFKVGDLFFFTGLVKREVLINEIRYLEIEIVPDELYFYFFKSLSDYFEIVEEVEKVEN